MQAGADGLCFLEGSTLGGELMTGFQQGQGHLALLSAVLFALLAQGGVLLEVLEERRALPEEGDPGAVLGPLLGQLLQAGGIEEIITFAKCHVGFAYYPTKVGNVHPSLKFDLLGAQIDAISSFADTDTDSRQAHGDGGSSAIMV